MDPNPSPYLLLFRGAPEAYKPLSAEQRQQLMQQWNRWYDDLAARGKVHHGHPLDPGGRVVSGPQGERIRDGPFAETNEAVGGYFLLTVRDLDEATAIARQCPSLPFGMSIEVRAIAAECIRTGAAARPEARHAASIG